MKTVDEKTEEFFKYFDSVEAKYNEALQTDDYILCREEFVHAAQKNHNEETKKLEKLITLTAKELEKKIKELAETKTKTDDWLHKLIADDYKQWKRKN